jgi:hypothetical protein
LHVLYKKGWKFPLDIVLLTVTHVILSTGLSSFHLLSFNQKTVTAKCLKKRLQPGWVFISPRLADTSDKQHSVCLSIFICKSGIICGYCEKCINASKALEDWLAHAKNCIFAIVAVIVLMLMLLMFVAVLQSTLLKNINYIHSSVTCILSLQFEKLLYFRIPHVMSFFIIFTKLL